MFNKQVSFQIPFTSLIQSFYGINSGCQNSLTILWIHKFHSINSFAIYLKHFETILKRIYSLCFLGKKKTNSLKRHQ